MYHLYQFPTAIIKFPMYLAEDVTSGGFSTLFPNVLEAPDHCYRIRGNEGLILLATINSFDTWKEEIESNYPELLL